MGSGLLSRNLVSLLVAASLTAGAFFLDQQRSRALETQTSLRWARQITSQVESMRLTARSRGEKDPLGWAVDYLTQGIEPRLIRITRLSAPASDSTDKETWSLDRTAGTFEYVRAYGSNDDSAIRVNLETGYSGFVGTKFRFTNDIGIACLFFGIYLLFYLHVALRAAGRTIAQLQERVIALIHRNPIDPAEPAGPDPALVSEWVSESKTAVAAVAVSIRDLLKQTQSLVSAARESEPPVSALREKIHVGLGELHGSRQALHKATIWMGQLEALAKSPESEEGRRKLQVALSRVREVCEKNEQMLLELETQIEPLAMDADLAVEAGRKVLEAAAGMGPRIQETKESLVLQSKLPQKLQGPAPEEDTEPFARVFPKPSVPDHPVRKRPRKSA